MFSPTTQFSLQVICMTSFKISMDLNSIESVHYTFRKLAEHAIMQYLMP